MGCLSLMGTEEGFICSACRDKLKPLRLSGNARVYICRECGEVLSGNVCQGCGKKAPPSLCAYSAFEYGGVIRELVHRFKFDGTYALSKWMAEEMLCALGPGSESRYTLIVPVPMHPFRRMLRGYNQAEKLGKSLSRRLGLPLSKALKRVRLTRSQVSLSTHERRQNLKNAFRVAGQVKGENILLVDDVRTTGSTVSECARTLLASGCESVTVLTFASAVMKENAPFTEQGNAGNRT